MATPRVIPEDEELLAAVSMGTEREDGKATEATDPLSARQ